MYSFEYMSTENIKHGSMATMISEFPESWKSN